MKIKDNIRKRSKQQRLIDNPLASAAAKGERLRRIRHLANLSREEFCADGEINITTLISWEIGRFGGLSAKGAKRVIERVAKEGVSCTPEWLLYEIGIGPEVRADYKRINKLTDKNATVIGRGDERANIIEELMLFKNLNKQAVDFVIEDDTMLPQYQIGDYVAGIMRFDEKIRSLIGYDCIIQINDGKIMMRKLQLGPRKKSFNLVSINLNSRAKDAIIYDVELASAAPIIWHRKKNPA